MARITINGVSIDPVAESHQIQAASLESADAARSNYIVIQTDGPLSDDQREQLEGLGVQIHEYVPENAYLAAYAPSDLGPIRSLPFVTWADVYNEGFKIPPPLRPGPEGGAASLLSAATSDSPSRQPRKIDVILHDDVDAEQVKGEIAAAAGLDPDDIETSRGKVRLTVQQGQLGQLASVDAVRNIEEAPERRLFNNVARPILHADVNLNGTSFQGEGEIVAIADTGFDRGSTTDVHPAFTGRVAKLYSLGRPNKANDPHSHGTHVAGSVLGDGNSSSMGGAIQGTAPGATLVFESVLDSNGGLALPADLHDLFEPPYLKDGARVHTNSWGDTTPGRPYNTSSREIDDMVWNHKDLAICFAAGNDGTDRNADGVVDPASIGSEAAAKNCITVGACESARPFQPTYNRYWPTDFPADPVASDLQANDPDGLVAFSSRGPTKEQRIKPDVVAPGTCILSTLSRDAKASTDFGKSSDPLYFFDSGTSMATPLVAGCVAVLRETLVKNGTDTPSAALLKALLINGAVEVKGQYTPSEAGASPNNNSGWGRVDLAGSVIIPGDDPNAGFREGSSLKQGEQETTEIDIPGERGVAATTLKITLVWSDPPGAALQNDLDLSVIASDGSERHGNMGTSDKFDRVNNVEQVLWEGIPAGKAQFVVAAHRITLATQPYALAWRIG